MTKKAKTILYTFAVIFCFAQSAGGYYSGDVRWYVEARSPFYFAEILLLVIVIIRCNKLLSKPDDEYFITTEKVYHIAEDFMALVGIVAGFSVVSMIPIFVFLPKRIFEDGYANGLFVLLLITGATFAFYCFAGSIFGKVKKQRDERMHPLSENLEDFYAFIHSTDEKKDEAAENMSEPEEMPDASQMLGELVPDEEDFQRHMRQISIANPAPETVQLWECSYCGSLNSAENEQCEFCGAEHENLDQ